MILAFVLFAAATVQPVDLVVRNGTVVTVDGSRRVIPRGAVAVEGGRIAAVGTEAEVDAGFRARQVLDAHGGIVMPGLVNAHTHAAMVLFRGVADDLKLMEWLQKYIFPAEKENVTADFVRAGTRLAAPSVPSPSRRPSASISRTGAAPEASFMLLCGQWATPAPASFRIARSEAVSQMPCAPSTPRRRMPSCCSCSVGVRPYRSRTCVCSSGDSER